MSAPIRAKVEADKLASPHLEENHGTRPENEHALAKPRVVRTLKDPPEIWDLVHETPAHFNPSGNFVARLTSRKTHRVLLLMLGVMLICGLAAFAFMTLRDGRTIGGVVAQVRERFGNSQTVLTSQASDPASASESALNAPVDAPANTSPSDAASALESELNAPLNTSPGAESVVDNTAPQPTGSQATDSQPTTPQPAVPSADNSVSAGQPLTNSTQPTGVSDAQTQASGPVVNNVSKRTASRAGRAAAWSGNKRVTVASGWQNADKPGDAPADKPSAKPSPTRGTSRVARPDSSGKPQTSQASQPLDLKRRYEKSSSDSASANKGSSTTLSPQLIAPPVTTSAPKAKVIQWP
ncbi:MAG: hypothetical protein ACR2G5_13830 [Pyrinomonadaceae bacterium]